MKTSTPLLPLFAIALFAISSANAQVFINPATIAIPEGPQSSGPASPYPATIVVSGTSGTITNLSVSLLGISHTFPDDLDVLLVGPTGVSTILMSDAGSTFDLLNATLTFAIGAPALPNDDPLAATGTYSPGNHSGNDATDLFPAPAPAAPYGISLVDFLGTSANGTWSLYVVDDAGGDIGEITGGFSLNITTSGGDTLPPTGVPEGGSALLLAGLAMTGVEALRRRLVR